VGTNVTATLSVALGFGSQAYEANTVSVGTAAFQRRIVNVGDGTIAAGSHDAVTGGQLFTTNQNVAIAQTTANTALADAAAAQATADTGLTHADAAQVRADEAFEAGRYFRANSTGPAPQPTGAEAIAVGGGAVASGDGSVAMGQNAQALNGAAVSIGTENVASGNGAVAIGDPNTATGQGAVALGNTNTATGIGAVAIGNQNVANGNSAVSLGSNAQATGAGSVAIGAGAVAGSAGQVALGSSGSTYTLAGIGSAASAAAQSGPTRFTTSDAAGNLALSDFGPGDIAQLDRVIRSDRRDSRAGIAAAVAMSSAPMPSAPGRTSYAVNGATFRGEQAVGISIAHRFDVRVPLALTAGLSHAGHKNTAARMGVAGEF
jgi:autotransporter adhesin